MKTTGISKSNSKFKFYTDWLEHENLPYHVLDWEKNNFDDIKKCSSLILTGGVDIFPEFYNDWEDGKNREEYIPQRDGFEFKLFDYALANKYPLLGICRGLQLINCRLNGSLISDIETIRGVNHKKISPAEDRIHDVKILDNSLLKEITGKAEGEINSSHHQAIERLGEGLMVNAKAPDGIIEGIEWAEKEGKAFMLGIQWHPERFKDGSSPFSKSIIERFKQETNNN
jgi:putative glutamine amidotransferase